jgi:hypothetical protein
MQIYELTQTDDVAIPIVEGLWNTLQAAFTKDPKLSGMSLKQKAQFMATNSAVDKIAEKSLDAWNVYVAQRSKVDPNFINDQNRYRNELKLFVEKNLLPPYTKLDQMTVKNEINTAINNIMTNRGDISKLQPFFNNLVDIAAVAQVDPRAANRTANPAAARQRPNQPGKQTPPTVGAITPQQAAQILTQFNISNTTAAGLGQVLQRAGGTNSLTRTGNQAVDAVLKSLGFTIT